MSNVRRVYVEKKTDFAVKAKELKHESSSIWESQLWSSTCINQI